MEGSSPEPAFRRFRFDRFELHERTGRLYERGKPLAATGKVIQLLLTLLERQGQIVDRTELQAQLWPDVHVTDGSLSRTVSRLRSLIGGTVVRTVAGRGYSVVSEVAVEVDVGRASRSEAIVGRDRELEAIAEGLAAIGAVVLYGPPGIGRTTLAAAMGTPIPLRSPSGSALGSALPEGWGSAGLVVLDDVHLDPRAVEHLGRWQAEAPGVRWLVTSTEPLPWSLARVIRLTGLADRDAVTLLTRLTGVVFDPDDPSVQAIVRSVDGNPLALELIAPHLRTMTPAELATRFPDPTPLLRSATHDLDQRMAERWSGLADEAREIVVRLATLKCRMPLPVVEVAAGSRVHPLLVDSVDRGWLDRESDGHTTFFGVPNLVRRWVGRWSDPNGFRADTRARLAGWAMPFAAQGEARTPDRSLLLEDARWLTAHADVFGELAESADAPDRMALALASTAALFQIGAIDRVISVLERALDGPATPIERAFAWCRIGCAKRLMGAFDEAIEAGARSVEAEVEGDRRLVAHLWVEYAMMLAAAGGDPEPAIARAEAIGGPDPVVRVNIAMAGASREGGIERLQRELKRPVPLRTRRTAQGALGVALVRQGRFDEAEARFRDWLAVHPDAPLTQLHGMKANLGLLMYHRGRWDEAEQWMDEVATLPWSQRTLAAGTYRIRGRIASGTGWEELVEAMSRAAEVHRAFGASTQVAHALVALWEGKPAVARQRLREATDMSPTLPMILTAIACAQLGALDEAEIWIDRARRSNCGVMLAGGLKLADVWVRWARDDPSWIARVAEMEVQPSPWVASMRDRLLEARWLVPEARSGATPTPVPRAFPPA